MPNTNTNAKTAERAMFVLSRSRMCDPGVTRTDSLWRDAFKTVSGGKDVEAEVEVEIEAGEGDAATVVAAPAVAAECEAAAVVETAFADDAVDAVGAFSATAAAASAAGAAAAAAAAAAAVAAATTTMGVGMCLSRATSAEATA